MVCYRRVINITASLRLNKSFILWFTGLPSSGKTTLSEHIGKSLQFDNGVKVTVLDGDILRQQPSNNLGYSPKDRMIHNLRVAKKADEIAQSGSPVVVALISPYLKVREQIKSKFQNVIELYVKCPVKVCQSRDPKGLYKLAKEGKIKNFTGIDAPYEEPPNPEIVVETNKMNLKECTSLIITTLEKMDYIQVINQP